MSPVTAAPPVPPPSQPASARPIWLFFIATFVITWTPQVPAALAQQGFLSTPAASFMPWAGLGIFGPVLAAVLVCLLDREAGGVRALFRRLKMWQVAPAWYAIALLSPAAILAAGLGLYMLATGRDEALTYLPTEPERIAAFFVVPFAEEIGWRGFALPRMQQRTSPLAAALVLGTIWTVWHVPMLLMADVPLDLLPLMLPYFVAGSVLFSWIFNHTGGSLLLMVVAHMGAHLANTHKPLPGNAVPFIAHTVGLVVVATALVLLDRKVWRRQKPPVP